MKKFIALALLVASAAYAVDKTWVKNEVFYQSGTTDPTSSAINGDIGMWYFKTDTSSLYWKKDSGRSTNWIALQSATDAAKIAAINCAASAGGATTEALTCTGLLTTDTILAISQTTAGGNNTALIGYSTVVTNGLTARWTANPGSGAIVRVLVKHQ